MSAPRWVSGATLVKVSGDEPTYRCLHCGTRIDQTRPLIKGAPPRFCRGSKCAASFNQGCKPKQPSKLASQPAGAHHGMKSER